MVVQRVPRNHLLFWWLASNHQSSSSSSSSCRAVAHHQIFAVNRGSKTEKLLLLQFFCLHGFRLTFVSSESSSVGPPMAEAMRTCVMMASLTSLSPAADRRALRLISLRPTNGRTPRRGVSLLSSSSSDVQAAILASPPEIEQDSAAEVVRSFYKGINNQNISAVEGLIADKCVYEDLIFPRPFVGREAILDFFKKFNDIIGTDLRFVIDDISEEDSLCVGVTWHLEWKGKPFPFSKGCSFYRLEVINGKRQIIYGRDSVEPAFKPGETALVAIRGVVGLLQRFPQLADWL